MYLWMLGVPQRGCLFIVAARYYGGAILEIHLPISSALRISHYRWSFCFFLFQPRFRSIVVFTHCCASWSRSFSIFFDDYRSCGFFPRETVDKSKNKLERFSRSYRENFAKQIHANSKKLIFFFLKSGNQKNPRFEISRLTFVGKFSNFPLNISLSFFPPRLTIRLHVRIYSS